MFRTYVASLAPACILISSWNLAKSNGLRGEVATSAALKAKTSPQKLMATMKWLLGLQ